MLRVRALAADSALRVIWPHLRVVLVFAHVVAVLVLALPAPSYLWTRDARRAPLYRMEADAWSQRLRALGVDVTGAQLEAGVLDLGQRYLRVRNELVAPFETYALYFGVRQGWRMFTNPQTFPVRVHIEVRRAGADFEPVYVQQSEHYTWRRSQFEHNRVRKLLGRIGRGSTAFGYDELGAWVARAAAADFPDAAQLRMRVERTATLPPEAVREGRRASGEFLDPRIYDLEELRR